MEKLQYIDLLSIHGVSKEEELPLCRNHFKVTQKWIKEGKIKHVGFSTHGCPDMIRQAIMMEEFEYINIHATYFGSYHASGLQNSVCGGFGNYENVKLAKQRDMGVLIISPFDKGGKLFKPTKTVVDICGDLTPMEFQSLYCWDDESLGADTITVGIARESDFDDCISSAMKYKDESSLQYMRTVKRKLDDKWKTTLGDWAGRCYDNLPSHHDEKSHGVAFGMIVWLHNLVTVFGMREYAYDRYSSLKAGSKQWNDKKSFKTNFDKMR